MATTNFLNFQTNTSPATSDYVVGFVDDPSVRGRYEHKITFKSLFDYFTTYNATLTGITPSQLSQGGPSWDAFGNLTVSNQLNVPVILATGNISTLNGVIFSQGASNAVAVFDRNGSGTSASFYKEGGNNYLAGTTSGTVITYTSAGNVGIGNTSPVTKLDIQTGSQNSTNGITLNSTNGIIRLLPSSGEGFYNGLVRSGDQTLVFAASAGPASGAFSLVPWSNTTSGIRMLSSGSVGVNTAFPNRTLTVVGDISATNNITTNTLTTNTLTASSIIANITPSLPGYLRYHDNTANNRTSPFTFTRTFSGFYVSAGDINFYSQSGGSISLQYHIRLNSPVSQSVTQFVQYSDDTSTYWLNGSQVGQIANGGRGTITYNLIAGTNTIDIIHNNSGGTLMELNIIGDFFYRYPNITFVPGY